jgi:exodeoxyribonuclease VII large subunit
MEKQHLTLTELTGKIGNSIAAAFPDRYWIVAEINEIRDNSSGHCYLELVEKDPGNDSIISRCRATIWAYTWKMLKPYFELSTGHAPEKGMTVLVEVGVVYHSLYGLSLNIKDIDPAYTIGDLEKRRTEIIRQLEKEGIIDMNRELEFPLLPSQIAVISSPGAAGYGDFVHQIENNPKKYRFMVTLFPAIMQGSEAVRSITGALDDIFNSRKSFEVVVILRGGGATSDLNCFNTYEIASHIAQFPVPVITGIGHERDQTIAGLVAHTDLKTPTAVAEFMVDRYRDVDIKLGETGSRLTSRVKGIISNNRHLLENTGSILPAMVNNHLETNKKHLNSTGALLARSATRFIQQNRHNLIMKHSRFGYMIKNYLLRLKNMQGEISRHLLPASVRNKTRKENERLRMHEKSVWLSDPVNILAKGYSLTYQREKIVKKAGDIDPGEIMETIFHDGRIKSKVLNGND